MRGARIEMNPWRRRFVGAAAECWAKIHYTCRCLGIFGFPRQPGMNLGWCSVVAGFLRKIVNDFIAAMHVFCLCLSDFFITSPICARRACFVWRPNVLLLVDNYG